ncbi:hypothetical protein DERF_006951 [Dermatophagoides farinae]|uniref:Uncharacterized protein n=1 Tax=Dermatophagoides farinae TaxID=6954 RepID=A0A922I183_DERFA|nr:hypothetical protein DERF_006951 [Dermatophagoides farinae]
MRRPYVEQICDESAHWRYPYTQTST